MRSLFGLALVCLFGSLVAAQDQPRVRFTVTPDLDNYPQATPKEAFASVIRAINRERYDYLVAHLMEPDFVDQRLLTAKITAEQFTKEVKENFAADPELLRGLKRFEAEGELVEQGASAVVQLKDVKDRKVYFKKIGERWFIENRREEKAADK